MLIEPLNIYLDEQICYFDNDIRTSKNEIIKLVEEQVPEIT